MGIEALLLSQVITISGTTGQVVTKQADGSLALEDAAGGGLDNLTEALATASPNNVVNNVSLTATGDTTNVSVAIVPKGTGAFSLSVPDGTAAGGNARGANAIDLQRVRNAATQVASGSDSFSVGSYCTASNSNAIAMGSAATSSGFNALAVGDFVAATGNFSYAFGRGTTSAWHSYGFGRNFLCNRAGQYAYANGMFVTVGDAQFTRFVIRGKTIDATPVGLLLSSGFGSNLSDRLTIPSGKILFANILISGIKSDGTAASTYKRKVAIKNVAGTTTLVGSVETIGTDHEDDAATDVAITADDTNNALQINVTGIADETWRWVAVVEGLEIAYGT